MPNDNEHTPEENAMLAEVYLDIAGRRMTRKEATAYLRAQYSHHPSAATVKTYLSAAEHCHDDLVAGVTYNDRKYRYSKELYRQMHLAIAKRRV